MAVRKLSMAGAALLAALLAAGCSRTEPAGEPRNAGAANAGAGVNSAQGGASTAAAEPGANSQVTVATADTKSGAGNGEERRGPTRQARDQAAPFELIGERRIPIVGLLRRDPQDGACWVAEEPGLGLERVCAR
jgi:hypothetical protein